MTRFLYWRKMTWALLLWGGGIGAWAVFSAVGSSGECASDFGPNSDFLTRQDCLAAAAGGAGGSALIWIAVLGLLGLGLLGFAWFTSRPLWRHGHGARLRRLRDPQTGWARRSFSEPE